MTRHISQLKDERRRAVTLQHEGSVHTLPDVFCRHWRPSPATERLQTETRLNQPSIDPLICCVSAQDQKTGRAGNRGISAL